MNEEANKLSWSELLNENQNRDQLSHLSSTFSRILTSLVKKSALRILTLTSTKHLHRQRRQIAFCSRGRWGTFTSGAVWAVPLFQKLFKSYRQNPCKYSAATLKDGWLLFLPEKEARIFHKLTFFILGCQKLIFAPVLFTYPV